ncbi:MAG: nickel-dependent hydrogenase large subunit [Rhodoferax sp.]
MSAALELGGSMNTRVVLGPFNRIEGDLEVQLEVADGRVASARVNAPMFRGFEMTLVGREAMDALTIAPRICGICSVSQSVAAARALADLSGVEIPVNGQLAHNLMLGCENLADHLTHFYTFFLPDFTRAQYRAQPWFSVAQQRFGAVLGGTGSCGEQVRAALVARARWLELMGALGGKWPHTGAILPGGSSRTLDTAERLHLGARVREMRDFLQRQVWGLPLESVLTLTSWNELLAALERAPDSDVAWWLRFAQDLQLGTLGLGPGRLLSYGAYPTLDGALTWAQGLVAASAPPQALDMNSISEDVHSSWLHAGAHATPRHPWQGSTEPCADKPGAYTWNKAPRWAGAVVETGALARQVVDGQPLVRAAHAQWGASVLTRVLARLVEMPRIVLCMEQWLGALRNHEPFHRQQPLPAQGRGVGLCEAARGALGHWLRVEDGRISHYQIIAPTSWNFSPRDQHGTPGALEAALVGAPMDADDPQQSTAVQHIVRSFDPCMVCTVH